MRNIDEEMRKSERALFGDGTHYVYKDENGRWIIEARGEEFDKNPYKETPAYTADYTYDPEHKTVLLKWAKEFGYESRLLEELYNLYNQQMAVRDATIAKCVLLINRDMPEYWDRFDGSDEQAHGLAVAFRNYYLGYADKHEIALIGEEIHHSEYAVTKDKNTSKSKNTKKAKKPAKPPKK